MSKPKESDLYEPVRKWLLRKSGLNCDSAPTANRGVRHARPDVTGIRHVGGNLRGDFELISVEVKPSNERFVASAGQASAYRLFADRAYLACYFEKGSFAEDDFEVAGHLGIGLIRIDSKLRCHRESRAPAATPIPQKRQVLLEHLGFVVCQICEVSFPKTGDLKDLDGGHWRGLSRKDIETAVNEERGYMFWNYTWAEQKGRLRKGSTYDRRYLCADCVYNFFQHLGDWD